MVERCSSCGVELVTAEDHAGNDVSVPYCSACADEDGELLPRSVVEERVLERLAEDREIEDREQALFEIRRKLDELPAWK